MPGLNFNYGSSSGGGNPYSGSPLYDRGTRSAASGRTPGSTKRNSNRTWTDANGIQHNESEEYGPSLDETLGTRDKYNQAAEARRMASIQALMAGGGGAPGGEGGDDGGPAFDEAGARASAFARAKDQAGQIARSSLDSLRQNLGNTGRLGGVHEAQATAQVAGGAANELGEFNRDQLMTDLNRAGEIGDRNYAGRLTRRGQDISRAQSLMALLNSSGGALY